MIPSTVVCAESDGSHDIRMIERLGNGEFRFDLADVLFLGLPGGSLSELLDRVVRWVVTFLVPFAKHDPHRGACALSDFLLPTELGEWSKLGFQGADIDDKIVRRTRAQSAGFQS